MPTGEERVADRLFAHIEGKLTTCNTEECRKMREEAEEYRRKVVEEADMKSLAKLDKLDEDIVKLLEGVEKMMNTPVEVPPCPHCGYDSDEKPKVVGRCTGEDGDHEVTYDEYDKQKGYKKCTVCGEDIVWDE